MYAYLPFTMPGWVRCSAVVALATPKSISFTSPRVESSTFCGLTSRWITLSGSPRAPIAVWAWCSAEANCEPMRAASTSGTKPPSSACAAMNPALVIIPTYNELDNLPNITQAVLEAEQRVDVLVVDDSSPDGTGQLADQLAAKQPRIQVLHREQKQGLGRAYLHAFDWAL